MKNINFLINIYKEIIDKNSFILLIFLVITAILTPLITWLYKIMIDLFSNKQTDYSFVILVIVGYVVLQYTLEFIENIQMHTGIKVNYKMNNIIIHNINKKINRIKIELFEDSDIYDLMERIKSSMASDTVNSFGTIFSLIASILTTISYIILIGSVEFYFPILIFLSSIPFLIYIIKKNKRLYLQKVELGVEKRRIDYLNEVLTQRENAKEIRVFKLLDFFDDKIYSCRKFVYNKELKVNKKQIIESVFASIFQNIALGLCFALTCYGYYKNKYSIGEIILVFTVVQQIISKIAIILNNIETVNEFSYNFKDWIKFFELQEEEIGGNIDKTDIYMKNVSFKYPNSESYVLKEIDLQIKTNEKIALVGENGSGKTTLINLLLGLYSPTEGEIYIGNKNLKNTLHDFRSKTICIFQNYIKYQMSLEDNLTVGNLGKKVEKWNENVKKILSFVDKLPNKEKTILGNITKNGIELSGGQWQRIAIARGLNRENLKYIIMDEPTASTDPTVENEIYENFADICNNKTVILISHRLSAARLCDRILVLDKGRIIEEGSHDNLMLQRGKYYKMYECQKKLYENLKKRKELV